MAEYFRKAFESNRRATRSDINSTGMSLNKNGEFRIPTVPSRCATQTLYSSALSNQNTEPSALECLKPIGDKFEVIDKLQIIPIVSKHFYCKFLTFSHLLKICFFFQFEEFQVRAYVYFMRYCNLFYRKK